MSNHMKLFHSFWTGETGKQIKEAGVDTQMMAAYLITSHHASRLGIYYLPISYIAYDMNMTTEDASKWLQKLCDIGFCCYDKDAEHVWVCNMARYQIGKSRKSDSRRSKKIKETVSTFSDLSFFNAFYEKYQEYFCLDARPCQ